MDPMNPLAVRGDYRVDEFRDGKRVTAVPFAPQVFHARSEKKRRNAHKLCITAQRQAVSAQ